MPSPEIVHALLSTETQRALSLPTAALILGALSQVAFETSVRGDSLDDRSAHSSCFGVPFDMLATIEHFGHISVPTEGKLDRARQSSVEERCQRCLPHREEYRVLVSAFALLLVLLTARRY